jgi:hypothetical protein
VAEARHQRLEDSRDLLLELLVQDQLTLAEARDGLDGHVVRGWTQAAARNDEVHALVGQKAQLRLDVVRAVAADRDVRQLHPELEQPVRDPGAVTVLNSPGQHLCAGHDDASSRAQGL